MPHRERDQIVRRVKGEFAEMPGLQLTAGQAERLWGLDHETCRDVLQELVAANYLTRTDDGRYKPATADPGRRTPVRATHRRPARRNDVA
jgi:hypothetical protein